MILILTFTIIIFCDIHLSLNGKRRGNTMHVTMHCFNYLLVGKVAFRLFN